MLRRPSETTEEEEGGSEDELELTELGACTDEETASGRSQAVTDDSVSPLVLGSVIKGLPSPHEMSW